MKTWKAQRPKPIEPKRERYGHQTSYANRKWMAAAKAFLSQYPFCVLCLARGVVNEGADKYAVQGQRNLVVDHIKPHRGDCDLFWDQDNWQTLCKAPCHDGVKRSVEMRSGDWYAHLRKEYEDAGRRDQIVRLAAYVPQHVLEALGLQDVVRG